MRTFKKALDMNHDELMKMSSLQNINKPVEQWCADKNMEEMILLEGVLPKQLWEYVPFLIQNGVDLNHCSEFSPDKPSQETLLSKLICDKHPDVPPEVLGQLLTPHNIKCTIAYCSTPLHDAWLWKYNRYGDQNVFMNRMYTKI